MLTIRNLDYRYFNENRYIFYQFSLNIPKQKKIALLGQNGSGKTTLLLLIDGLLKAEKGGIYWEQELLKHHPKNLKQWRKRIGLTFQNPEQQLVAGTVAEDISYGLCNFQLSKQEIKERLEQILKDFELELLANEPLHHLSLGQKRRVALAGVMALKPQLLLLDEPTTYLDQEQTNNLKKELERIYSEGTTILIATHDLNFAYEWADWFIFLHQGKVILEGEAKEVFSQRKILAQIKIELPILWEVWETLPFNIKGEKTHNYPKNITEFKNLLIY